VTGFSVARARRWGWSLGAAGALATLLLRGPGEAAGFALGAALALASLYSWIRISGAVGVSLARPPRASALFLSLRFVVIGLVVYAIVKFFGAAPAPMIAGLLVSFAAVVAELLYALWKSTSWP
jgi:hypothetical protein